MIVHWLPKKLYISEHHVSDKLAYLQAVFVHIDRCCLGEKGEGGENNEIILDQSE